MWLRLLRAAIRRARGGFVAMLVATSLGCALVSALLAVSWGVQNKISHELNRYGANIQVVPATGRATLPDADLVNLKNAIFWRHNIVGVTPYLYQTARFAGPSGEAGGVVAGTWFDRDLGAQEPFRTGLATTAPYLKLTGRWPKDADAAETVLGVDLARRLGARVGDRVTVAAGPASSTLTVVGLAEGGGYEDAQAMLPLAHLQRVLGAEGEVSQVLVSAVTVPLDAFGRRDPRTMTRREYDKWYCTAYVTSVAAEIQSTLKGSSARPVWSVVEAQGRVLSQLSLLIYLLVGLSLAASVLAVSTTLTSDVLRRRGDVGLLKALGGEPLRVAAVLLAETLAAALIAAVIGFGLGWLLADYIGRTVFGSPFEFQLLLLPISVGVALLVTLVGSFVPLREALRVPPAEVMAG
jgi:putative ABC transport system permease protein